MTQAVASGRTSGLFAYPCGARRTKPGPFLPSTKNPPMTEATYIQEYNAITDILNHYVEGNATGASAATKRAFHAQATVFGLDGSNVVGPEIQKLYDIIDTLGVSPKARAVIARVNVAGTAANARVDSENVAGHRFTDFFNLLKIDGTWIIVNKIYHSYTGA